VVDFLVSSARSSDASTRCHTNFAFKLIGICKCQMILHLRGYGILFLMLFTFTKHISILLEEKQNETKQDTKSEIQAPRNLMTIIFAFFLRRLVRHHCHLIMISHQRQDGGTKHTKINIKIR